MTESIVTPVAGLGLEKKLLISSSVLALALGTGLGAAPAHAGTVIYHLDQYLGAGDSYTFGPYGGDEFTITNVGSGLGFESLTLQGNDTLTENLVAVKDLPTLATLDPEGILERFAPGDVVDSNSNFAGSGIDEVAKGSTVYYGLDVILGGEEPFGALKLDVLNDGTLFLDAFAFQTEPRIGQPVPFPEPGTLALFAVGASALLGVRRRKKAKTN